MPITHQLQQAADDLGAVEQGLIALYEMLPCAIAVPSPQTPAPHIPKVIGPKRPRCSQVTLFDEPCKLPATRPYGLCGSHFYRMFGHQGVWDYGAQTTTCRHCGVTFHGYSSPEQKAAGIEFCPKRVISEHALEVEAKYRAGVSA